jgi:hypothetical protein
VHPSALEETHGGSVCAHLRVRPRPRSSNAGLVLAPSLAIHLHRRMLEQILSKNQTKLLIQAFSRHGQTTHGSRLYSPSRVLLGSVLPSRAGFADGGVAEIAVEIAGERGTLEREIRNGIDTEPNGLARVEALTSGSAREWIVARFGARVDRTSGRRLCEAVTFRFVTACYDEVITKKKASTACSLGLSDTSQQYFSHRTNQPPATRQQYSSLRTNQHQPSATGQPNRLQIVTRCGTWTLRADAHPRPLRSMCQVPLSTYTSPESRWTQEEAAQPEGQRPTRPSIEWFSYHFGVTTPTHLRHGRQGRMAAVACRRLAPPLASPMGGFGDPPERLPGVFPLRHLHFLVPGPRALQAACRHHLSFLSTPLDVWPVCKW